MLETEKTGARNLFLNLWCMNFTLFGYITFCDPMSAGLINSNLKY